MLSRFGHAYLPIQVHNLTAEPGDPRQEVIDIAADVQAHQAAVLVDVVNQPFLARPDQAFV